MKQTRFWGVCTPCVRYLPRYVRICDRRQSIEGVQLEAATAIEDEIASYRGTGQAGVYMYTRDGWPLSRGASDLFVRRVPWMQGVGGHAQPTVLLLRISSLGLRRRLKSDTPPHIRSTAVVYMDIIWISIRSNASPPITGHVVPDVYPLMLPGPAYNSSICHSLCLFLVRKNLSAQGSFDELSHGAWGWFQGWFQPSTSERWLECCSMGPG